MTTNPLTEAESVFKFSAPTKVQVVSAVERVIAVFVVSAYGIWQVSGEQFSSSTGHAAVLAGATAVYGVVKSFLTTL